MPLHLVSKVIQINIIIILSMYIIILCKALKYYSSAKINKLEVKVNILFLCPLHTLSFLYQKLENSNEITAISSSSIIITVENSRDAWMSKGFIYRHVALYHTTNSIDW